MAYIVKLTVTHTETGREVARDLTVDQNQLSYAVRVVAGSMADTLEEDVDA